MRWLWFLALALTIGSLGFRLICLRGARRAAGARAAARRRRRRSGSSARSRSGSPRSRLRAEDVLQLPFGKFLYGDLSPIDADALRPGVHRHDARLRGRRWRLIFLSWLTRPRRAARAGVRALDRAHRRALGLGPRRGRRRLVVADRGRRLGAHLGGVALDRRARDDGRAGLVRRARAAARRVLPLLAAGDGAGRARARRRHLPQRSSGCRTCAISGRSGTGRCCS